ncbi:MAG: hypothetical protein K6A23_11480 [Butyrivibrio sp.]|nr:hypothetical protein [Butyrivibrio sp.]
MSDENMNNNEETAALFVSAQKKKKAEEEAKKKAAEEQAKRDAAEAEVRKMEQEVEERKRKAEEEKKALEEAEKKKQQERQNEAAKVEKVVEKVTKSPVVEKMSGGKQGSKLPIFIGVGVAAVAIVLIAVFAMGGKSSKASVDFANAEFAKEVKSSVEGFDIPFVYPESEFTKVEETTFEESNLITLSGGKSGIKANIAVGKVLSEDSDDNMVVSILGLNGAEDFAANLAYNCEECMKNLYGENVEISNPVTCDVSSNPGRYSYTCEFTSPDYEYGRCEGWYEPNSSGIYRLVVFSCVGAESQEDSLTQLTTTFADKNAADALMVPGGSPLESTENDGMIRISSCHMGIPVPKDRFQQNEKITSFTLCTDKNAASVIVHVMDADTDLETVAANNEVFMKYIREAVIKEGADFYLGDIVESRTIETEQEYSADTWACAYHADFKDVIGGVTYWERYFAAYWKDTTTDNVYLTVIVMVAPEVNRTQYQEVFEKSIKELTDI